MDKQNIWCDAFLLHDAATIFHCGDSIVSSDQGTFLH